jgi:TonB family protein
MRLQLFLLVLLTGTLQLVAQSSSPQNDTSGTQSATTNREEKKEMPKAQPQVKLGKLIHKVAPAYPPAARMQHIHGTVRVRVLIDKEGKVTQLEPVSGPQELIPAALDAVRQWRYEPALLDGKPVDIHTEITVNFK